MADYSWLQTVDRLSPAGLTVNAQAVPADDQGQLLWDVFFPRMDVDSVDLRELTRPRYRPAADRREWNARGRHIPLLTPAQRDMSIVPIEAYDIIDEYEMQKLSERNAGDAARIRDVIGANLPDRAQGLALANYRRLEVDTFTAWANGTVTQRDPQNASQTYVASYGIDSTRITAAGTAWNDAGLNAFDTFVTWYLAAMQLAGPGEAVMLRQATLNAILADAPTTVVGFKMTRADIERRVEDSTGGPFRFIVNENTVDVFTDGGTAVASTKVWPAQKVAFVPAGGSVGVTAFAPVVRAMEMNAAVPGARVDVRGNTVYYESANGGRELLIECQLNAMPVPDEQRVVVIDAGV